MKFLIVLFLASPVQLHAAGDPAAGKTKSGTCVACHGATGISANDLWPNIAGQKQTYLAHSIRHYRSGERVDPLMTPIAKMLSEADIDDLAAYYASLKP